MMIFRPHLLLLLVATACALSATPCAAQEAPPADDLALAPRISTAELKALVARGEVLVLDVRDPEAYKNGHIPGAVSVPLADIPARAAALGGEKRPIVTYCAWPAEHTSARAALELAKLGIANVRALKGGLKGWQGDGNRIVKGGSPQ